MAVAIISPIGSVWDHPLVPPLARPQEGAAAQDTAAEAAPSRQGAAAEPQAQAGGPSPAVPDATARASQPADSSPGEEQGGGGGREDGRNRPGVGEGGEAAPASGGGKSAGGRELSRQELAELQRLQQRDRQVRAHEQAHKAAGGRYVRGGARYQYRTGPDGRHYAVGGEVSIDTSEASSPEATIRKAQAVKRAALAPAQPSPQDRQVAAQAAQMEQQARAELARQRQEQARLASEQKAAGARDQGQGSSLSAGAGEGAASGGRATELFPPPRSTSGPPPFSVRLNPLNRLA